MAIVKMVRNIRCNTKHTLYTINKTKIHTNTIYRRIHATYCLQVLSSIAEMGDRLATIDVGRKLGTVPLWRDLGPHLTQ